MKVGDIVQNGRHIGVLVETYPDGRCRVESSKVVSLAFLKNLRFIRSSEEEKSRSIEYERLASLKEAEDAKIHLQKRAEEAEVHIRIAEKAKERGRTEALKRAEMNERDRIEALRKKIELLRIKENKIIIDQLFETTHQKLASDYLNVDSFFNESCSTLITQQEFERLKIAFIKSWIAENIPCKNGIQILPDDEQANVIAAVHGNIQVIARAGSGKTTTLVNRTLFLLKHCGVDANEMMLLAFNRKAVSEIRHRLLVLLNPKAEKELLDEIRRLKTGNYKINYSQIESDAVQTISKRHNVILPHVMTFHALAYSIIHPEEAILYDGNEDETQALSRVFQAVIDDHFKYPEFIDKVRTLMLAHFKNDWDQIFSGGYYLNQEEFLKYRRSLKQQSLNGESIKSSGEKIIADFLFEHNITYKYEQNHWWNDLNYRPDFTLYLTDRTGVIIEYFGLKGNIEYDVMSRQKRQYWSQRDDWELLVFYPSDIASNGSENFLATLKERLQILGFPCKKLSEDEIWYRIKDRAIDQFTKAMNGFIGRCRKLSYSISDLQKSISDYKPVYNSEMMFHMLAKTLYEAYLNRLSSTGEDDFNGLMQRASDAVNDGKVLFERKSGNGDLSALRYLCIDEFQDFSDLFFKLLTAIRSKNSNLELFCVGDDWQSINGFAGSDLRFFTDFSKYIDQSKQFYISTNYRSSKEIVNIGNELMIGLGKPAVAHKELFGSVLIADITEFKPSTVEKEKHRFDKITPMILRMANKSIAEGKDVILLFRMNPIQRYIDHIRSFFPNDLKGRISFSTTHKFKGLESSVVIIPDAFDRNYPLIHPHWIFSRIFGENPITITKEERRLFYVALTRAIDQLIIITESQVESPFLKQLLISKVNWTHFPPPINSSATRLIMKISNREHRGKTTTYDIRNLLKASNYKFETTSKSWVKSFQTEGFNIETIKLEVWTASCDGIEIHIFNETNKLLAHYLINDSKWILIFNALDQKSNVP